MALQMFGARFRQWFVTTEACRKRDFVVPWPQKPQQPKEVQQYMKAAWAAGKISLLDVLRKTARTHHLKLRAKNAPGLPLGEFAARYDAMRCKVRRLWPQRCSRASMTSSTDTGSCCAYRFKRPRTSLFLSRNSWLWCPTSTRTSPWPSCASTLWLGAHGLPLGACRLSCGWRQTPNLLCVPSRPWSRPVGTLCRSTWTARPTQPQKPRSARKSRPPGVLQGMKQPATSGSRGESKTASMEALIGPLPSNAAETEDAADTLVCCRRRVRTARSSPAQKVPGTGKTIVALACLTRMLELGGSVLFASHQPPIQSDASQASCRGGRRQLPRRLRPGRGSGIRGRQPGAVQPHHHRRTRCPICSSRTSSTFAGCGTRPMMPPPYSLQATMQMGGFGERRAWHSPMWKRMVYRIKLHDVYRCKNPEFNQVLMELRPKASTLKWLQKRKAWAPPQEPTVAGVRTLLKAHPDTVILTCIRHGAHTMNELALRALYPSGSPLVLLPADVDSNPDNYSGGQPPENMSALEPLRPPSTRACGWSSPGTFAKTSIMSMGWMAVWRLSTQARKAWRCSLSPAFG